MKFGHVFLRKITEFVATSCKIWRLKCTKFNFGWGSAPDPAALGELTALPRPPSWIEMSLHLMKGRGRVKNGEGQRKEGKEKGQKRRGEEGSGGEGRGEKEKEGNPQGLVHTPMFEILKNTGTKLSPSISLRAVLLEQMDSTFRWGTYSHIKFLFMTPIRPPSFFVTRTRGHL